MYVRFRLVLATLAIAAATASAAANDSFAGKRFPSFKAEDAITGKPLTLESLRGKVVLIDFWATWCGPCVGELPNVRKTYEKYKDQGFEIVSVSLDSNRDKFKRFVRAQKMSWHHVMEGGGWRTRLAKQYRINSIPAMYLIDHEGNCISDRARGRALETAVKAAVARIPNAAGKPGRTAPPSAVERSPEAEPVPETGADMADHQRVLIKIAEMRESLGAAAAPVAALGRRLVLVGNSINSIDRQMPAPKSTASLRRRYIAMHDELAAIRREMYAHGMLNKEIPALPANPFDDPDIDERRGLTFAWGELPDARKAVEDLGLLVNVVSRQVSAAKTSLDRIERDLARDPTSVTQAARAQAIVNADRLATRCRDGWESQIKVVARNLSKHASPEGEKLRTELAALREMLADEDADLAAARKRFATLCGKVLALED